MNPEGIQSISPGLGRLGDLPRGAVYRIIFSTLKALHGHPEGMQLFQSCVVMY